MTLSIAQEFSLALVEDRAEEDSYKPLIEKFEELKKILQSNFKITDTSRKWYGKKVTETKPVHDVKIEDKIAHSSGKYLYISINRFRYVMGLGEIGELKDRLYFIAPISNLDSKGKTVVYLTNQMFGTYFHCLEDKITNVQMFVEMLKSYKQYLTPR